MIPIKGLVFNWKELLPNPAQLYTKQRRPSHATPCFKIMTFITLRKIFTQTYQILIKTHSFTDRPRRTSLQQHIKRYRYLPEGVTNKSLLKSKY